MGNQVGPRILFLSLSDVEMKLFFDLVSDGGRREELDKEAAPRRTTDEGRRIGPPFIKEFEMVFALVHIAFGPYPL